MKVPVYERQVGREAVSQQVPQVAAPPSSVGTTSVDAARVGGEAGKVVSDIGDMVAKRAIERQQMEDEKQVLAANTDYLKSKQDTLYSADTASTDHGDVPVGLLNRQLGQAKDAVVAYDADFAEKKQLFLERVQNENQKRVLSRLMDQDYTSTREQIIRHEREQTDKDFALTAKANIDQQVLNVASVKSPQAISETIKTSTGIQTAVMARMGASLDVIKLQAQDVADRIVASAVEGNLSTDVRTSQAILVAQKGNVSEQSYLKMQQVIDGKMLDLRRTAAWNAASADVHPDGTINLEKAQARTEGWLAAQKDLPVGQADHIMDFVRQQASIHDSVLKDKRDSTTRVFFNEAIALKNSGASYAQAEQQLFKVKGYGYDNTDREEKTRQLQQLFTRDDSFYDAAIKAQTPDQKAAWDDIKNMGVAKYGKSTVKLEGEDFARKKSDVFENEMMRKVLGQPPEQMRKIATDAIKDVVVDKKWWWLDTPAARVIDPAGILPKLFGSSTEPAYQLSAEHRAGEELKIAALQDVHGQGLVAQARKTFIRAGVANPSAKDIRDLIERANNGR